ncbi:hemolysin family protein [Undibacterium cyanobacteriorum]|uniref:Hemolysin family protein n=1 Tax=Undibacterium cyanobacteriorum TaxID=3073561 RepID=A0ABY9RFX9_9BURK|nr:hemolysin family protein [Undibacterium sp. 20NA77.5]WMW80114.1 hemolysin family protein [Undibacterium sp. 20NA77.5]
MEVFILIGLIVLNGIFAMSEIALVTARKARLMKLASDGDKAAAMALKLGEDPTKFLSTIQIGITSISILNGIVGEAIFAAPFSQWLQTFQIEERTANIGATAVVVIIVTYVSIVIGELVPKRLGQISPEAIARLVALPMQLLATVTRPFVVLLTVSTHTLLRVMGVSQDKPNSVTEEEIHAMLEEGSEAGVIEQHQHAMVRNVFRLDDRQLGSLMIPRSDLVCIDIKLPLEENLRRLIESEHSRFPVCDGGLHNLLGVIHAKQALTSVALGQAPDFRANLHPCIYVPETLTGMELLEQFRANQMQMAFVIDEYGEVEGIITLQDILEAVTGEFSPRNAEDAWAVQRHDGSWLLDGAIPIPEMKDRLELKQVPEEDRGRYHTLSGMMMLLLGKVPVTGEHANWEGWRFEVVDMDAKRIDKVLATPIVDDEEDEAQQAQ